MSSNTPSPLDQPITFALPVLDLQFSQTPTIEEFRDAYDLVASRPYPTFHDKEFAKQCLDASMQAFERIEMLINGEFTLFDLSAGNTYSVELLKDIDTLRDEEKDKKWEDLLKQIKSNTPVVKNIYEIKKLLQYKGTLSFETKPDPNSFFYFTYKLSDQLEYDIDDFGNIRFFALNNDKKHYIPYEYMSYLSAVFKSNLPSLDRNPSYPSPRYLISPTLVVDIALKNIVDKRKSKEH